MGGNPVKCKVDDPASCAAGKVSESIDFCPCPFTMGADGGDMAREIEGPEPLAPRPCPSSAKTRSGVSAPPRSAVDPSLYVRKKPAALPSLGAGEEGGGGPKTGRERKGTQRERTEDASAAEGADGPGVDVLAPDR